MDRKSVVKVRRTPMVASLPSVDFFHIAGPMVRSLPDLFNIIDGVPEVQMITSWHLVIACFSILGALFSRI